MKWLLLPLFLLSPLARADDGTYAYCSNDSCRMAPKGKLSLFFGSLPQDVKARCVEPGTYAMTFDDGPSSHYPAVLDILKKRNVRATFFVLGNHLKDPEARAWLKRAHEEGHQISNHSFSHVDLMKQSDAKVLQELRDTAAAIVAVLGDDPIVARDAKIMRPPFGYIDARVQKLLADDGFHSVRWNSDRGDWDLKAGDQALEMKRLDQHLDYLKRPANNSVIDLNHDFSAATLANLDAMIDRIEAASYRFVTVSSCLHPSQKTDPEP